MWSSQQWPSWTSLECSSTAKILISRMTMSKVALLGSLLYRLSLFASQLHKTLTRLSISNINVTTANFWRCRKSWELNSQLSLHRQNPIKILMLRRIITSFREVNPSLHGYSSKIFRAEKLKRVMTDHLWWLTWMNSTLKNRKNLNFKIIKEVNTMMRKCSWTLVSMRKLWRMPILLSLFILSLWIPVDLI